MHLQLQKHLAIWNFFIRYSLYKLLLNQVAGILCSRDFYRSLREKRKFTWKENSFQKKPWTFNYIPITTETFAVKLFSFIDAIDRVRWYQTHTFGAYMIAARRMWVSRWRRFGKVRLFFPHNLTLVTLVCNFRAIQAN